jgi:hypothetical protein
MRSSPKFLVVSRSEDSDRPFDPQPPEGGERLEWARPNRRDAVEFNELDIRLKVSYKTVLLVFVLFDVLHKAINVVFDTSLVEGIF